MVRDAEVDTQLRRILESAAFATSARSAQFLRFCVEYGCGGESAQLKETTIAVEVFNRPPNYDPKSDAIVRVHARRVREKLEMYYRTAGAHDPIKIEIPKGGYIPQIVRALHRPQADDVEGRSPQFASVVEMQPSVSQQSACTQPAPALPQRSKRPRWILATGGLLAIALMSFAAVWIWIGHQVRKPAALAELSPMDSLPGNVSDPAWSPDGRRLAFTGSLTPDGKTFVFVADTYGGLPAVRLTNEDATEMRPAWSPDGSEIALTRRID
jgi:hypothetical protein